MNRLLHDNSLNSNYHQKRARLQCFCQQYRIWGEQNGVGKTGKYPQDGFTCNEREIRIGRVVISVKLHRFS